MHVPCRQKIELPQKSSNLTVLSTKTSTHKAEGVHCTFVSQPDVHEHLLSVRLIPEVRHVRVHVLLCALLLRLLLPVREVPRHSVVLQELEKSTETRLFMFSRRWF